LELEVAGILTGFAELKPLPTAHHPIPRITRPGTEETRLIEQERQWYCSNQIQEGIMTTLREGIDWVGYVDWTVRDFHGYETKRGSTYNAYLVRDEKTALIDFVKAPYAGELLRHITELTEPGKVRYVVCNHAEPDHSGAMPEVMKALPNAELVCNAKCRRALERQFDCTGIRFKIVEEGETLELGRRSLQFFNTPMAHWPESMVTYVPEEKLLFSMDAFGQHYAVSERFDRDVPFCDAINEAKTYYANIIMLYGGPVQNALKKLGGLPLEIIAPSHGIIWTENIPDILAAYDRWSRHVPTAKVLIFFDSMWQNTRRMAEAIFEGADQPGVSVRLYDVKSTHITTLATEALDCAALAVGSPTLNKGMMPKIAEALVYLKGLAPEGKCGVAFGSYGWAKMGGPVEVDRMLREMNVNLLADPIQAQYAPAEADLEKCREAGRMLAERALKAIG